MINYLGCILIRFFSLVFCILPVGAGLFIGRRLGSAAFILNRGRRKVAYVNLKAAFCEEKSPAEIKRIVRGVYQNLGQVLVEVLRFPAVDKKYIEKFIALSDFEKVKEARSGGTGVLMLTGHFGNWELSSLIGSILDLPLSVLAREQKHTQLNELLNSYREMAGAKVIKKGLSTRMLIKALKSNEVVGILADQDAGKFGTFVDFFGRPTSTHSGAFVFAQKTGAKVLPAFIVRERGPYHTAHVLEPMELKYGAISKEELIRGVQKFSAILESYVRKFPTQWLWLHKRWKSTPHRSIVILNDGRSGHLNQSLAVADIIRRLRQDKGYRPEDTTYKVIDVKYKNRFSRFPLKALSGFSSSACQGCMACVKACLDDRSYKAFISAYADIVISCGDSLAPLNILLTRELNAKNIIIMKPSLVSLKKFNLAIVPRHDNPKPGRNVLITAGAPNRITDGELEKEALKFLSFIDLKKAARIGLILGGDNPSYRMEKGLVKEVISQIRAVSEKLGGLEILATTSRRTSPDVELLLKNELAVLANCKLLVIANEKNIEGTIPAILGLSGVVLVSGESISMISEAASSGRPVLVFPLSKKTTARTRHESLLEALGSEGFIKVTAVNKIGDEIENALNLKVPSKKLNDYDRIYNAVGAVT